MLKIYQVEGVFYTILYQINGTGKDRLQLKWRQNNATEPSQMERFIQGPTPNEQLKKEKDEDGHQFVSALWILLPEFTRSLCSHQFSNSTVFLLNKTLKRFLYCFHSLHLQFYRDRPAYAIVSGRQTNMWPMYSFFPCFNIHSSVENKTKWVNCFILATSNKQVSKFRK